MPDGSSNISKKKKKEKDVHAQHCFSNVETKLTLLRTISQILGALPMKLSNKNVCSHMSHRSIKSETDLKRLEMLTDRCFPSDSVMIHNLIQDKLEAFCLSGQSKPDFRGWSISVLLYFNCTARPLIK